MTTTTRPLAAWITARLDEDDAAARAAASGTEGVWRVSSDGAVAARGRYVARPLHDGLTGIMGDSTKHIARHDPARVLAQVAALRAVVEEEAGWVRRKKDAPAHNRGVEPDMWGEGRVEWVETHDGRLEGEAARAFIDEWYEPSPPSPTLRHIAAIWADAPGYDEAVAG